METLNSHLYIGSGKEIVSTLDRLYGNTEFQELVGLKIDRETGQASLVSETRCFEAVAKKIVGDYQNGDVNTRILGSKKSESFVNYLDDLRFTADDAMRSGPFANVHEVMNLGNGGGDLLENLPSTPQYPEPKDDSTTGSDFGEINQNQTTQNAPIQSKIRHLNIDGLVVSAKYPIISSILNELDTIDIIKYPNATYDLLRTFLEKTIKAYADHLGSSIRPSDRGYVQLFQCLVWFETYMRENKFTSLIQPTQKLKGHERFQNYRVSKDHMDAINHNFHVGATSRDVQDTWDLMRGLLHHMLR